MSTTARKRIIGIISGLVSGLAAASILVWIALSQGYESFARGMAIGGAIALGTLAVLWVMGGRAGSPGRIATGEADERDEALVTRASADASLGMLLGALAGTIAGLYGMPGPLVGGVVLWAGALAGLGSFAVRSARQ